MALRLILAVMVLAASTLNVSAATAPARKNGSKTTASKSRPATQRSAPVGISKDPYIGAITVDMTGKVLFEDNADATGYPASVVKLMDLLIVLERVQQGSLSLSNAVTVTAEAAGIGGSQVFLKEKEVFTVDELLYAMMIQSANDAATALALHIAGSKEAFVELMNRKAQELGMQKTKFTSVHGLPPSAGSGQQFDTTTARDLSILARALVNMPEALRYSSTVERPFRNGTFIMRNHNRLLADLPGCDGLKTGFISAGGWSIVATAQKNGVRAITVVLGSSGTRGLSRDAKAKEQLTKALAAATAVPATPVPPIATNVAQAAPAGAAPAAATDAKAPAATSEKTPAEDTPACPVTGRRVLLVVAGLLVGLVAGKLIFGRRSSGMML